MTLETIFGKAQTAPADAPDLADDPSDGLIEHARMMQAYDAGLIGNRANEPTADETDWRALDPSDGTPQVSDEDRERTAAWRASTGVNEDGTLATRTVDDASDERIEPPLAVEPAATPDISWQEDYPSNRMPFVADADAPRPSKHDPAARLLRAILRFKGGQMPAKEALAELLWLGYDYEPDEWSTRLIRKRAGIQVVNHSGTNVPSIWRLIEP